MSNPVPDTSIASCNMCEHAQWDPLHQRLVCNVRMLYAHNSSAYRCPCFTRYPGSDPDPSRPRMSDLWMPLPLAWNTMAESYRYAYWVLAGLNPGVDLSSRPWDYLAETEQFGIVLAFQLVLRSSPNESPAH